MTNVEQQRLADVFPWRRWGPYLSERQWGTVREDYGPPGGDTWGHLSHDQARSRAYRWGEDGIAGFSDDHQQLCLALAMWNGRDPILKERFFGLTNTEGNHGEDVKEYYFYLDGLPSHAYLRMIYKYPQAPFPYENLVVTNRNRGRADLEYELLDTGIFDEDRYFDVEVEYAKATPDDILCRITAHNRGPEPATLHLLPTLWFRDTGDGRATLLQVPGVPGGAVVEARHPELGRRRLLCQGAGPLLFTDNVDGRKDAIGRYVVHDEKDAVHTSSAGTKVAFWSVCEIPAGESVVLRVRLTDEPVPIEAVRERLSGPGFDAVVDRRRAEADEFYAERFGDDMSDGERQVARQALAGMLWSKQYYRYDVERWLTEHGRDPLEPGEFRNGDWNHLYADDIIAMPDTWEYPWFAAWDLAFHAVAFSVIDLDFAKRQLDLLLNRRYLHPNGQIPAYEWNFGDVNPPVHAWATYLVYELDKAHRGSGDRAWLAAAFQRLSRNFAWWVNRKDVDGRNVFQGGFLGLDNIGVFDRSAPLPTGGHLDQADGTAWMALYCQNMLQIALELARDDPAYLEPAQSYIEHFAWIAAAVNTSSLASMWDEEDGFFYDLLRLPDGTSMRLRVRSMVGLLPLAAATVFDPAVSARYPELIERTARFLDRHPSVRAALPAGRFAGRPGAHLLALFDETRLRRILARMLDENEFLSPYGIRSLSRHHAGLPFAFDVHGTEYRVAYTPAESDSGMFGGNSNWRGPVWFPVNALMIRALLNLYVGYGDDFTVECPTGSGVTMTLYDVARELSTRLTRLFLPGEDGRRPCYGGQDAFTREHWRDLILFSEYFHGDNGAGLGATHQTGWTGLAAVFPLLFARVSGPSLLENGMAGIFQAIDDEESR
jgi:mannosylglycerate hydrolase MGH1-like protein